MFRIATTITLLVLLFSGMEESSGFTKKYKHHSWIDSLAYNQGDLDSLNVYEVLTRIDSAHLRRFDVAPIEKAAKWGFMMHDTSINYKAIADSLGVRLISKADFDQNGHTDVLLVGGYSFDYCVLAVLDSGNNRCKWVTLTNERGPFQNIFFPVVRNSSAGPEIIIYSFPEDGPYPLPEHPAFKTDTLVARYRDFIERNTRPAIHQIERISFETQGCYGECPICSLSIDSSGKATYVASEYNKDKEGHEIKGTFTTLIDRETVKHLQEMVCYLDFPKLQDKYAVRWTDDWGCTIHITYDGGKVKSIHDYGMIGTRGLALLYSKLLKLRTTQQWQRK